MLFRSPVQAHSILLTTTVVFRLKNKLAKNYKLREWETSSGFDENGHLIVVNKNEDFNILLKRLMRYGTECYITSPKELVDKMKQLLDETLSNYDED